MQPPDAILPHINGAVNFTSVSGPDTGRVGNQGTSLYHHTVRPVTHVCSSTGFEGLSVDESTNTLWVLLQSATIQDGGSSSKTSRYTRLLAYDITFPLLERPPVKAEYVVPLPVSSKNKTFAASELHFVSENILLVLSRDGSGHGDDDTSSNYK